jgi:hypothetical protein
LDLGVPSLFVESPCVVGRLGITTHATTMELLGSDESEAVHGGV